MTTARTDLTEARLASHVASAQAAATLELLMPDLPPWAQTIAQAAVENAKQANARYHAMVDEAYLVTVGGGHG